MANHLNLVMMGLRVLNCLLSLDLLLVCLYIVRVDVSLDVIWHEPGLVAFRLLQDFGLHVLLLLLVLRLIVVEICAIKLNHLLESLLVTLSLG